jgi:hypothetical protein
MTTENLDNTASSRRVLVFRILAVVTGLLFLVAGITNALAGWKIGAGSTGDAHPDADRWFITVGGTADLIFAGSNLLLAWRPRLSLLFLYNLVGLVLATAINLPVDPRFAAIIAVVLPSMIAYPYWSSLRSVRSWWRRPRPVMLVVSALAAVTVFVIAGVAIGRQIGGTDIAAQGSWWADYAEHVSLLGVAPLLASSGRPGWRYLAGLAAVAWVDLGLVALIELPDSTGSWGTIGGLLALGVGAVLATACILDRPAAAPLPMRSAPAS